MTSLTFGINPELGRSWVGADMDDNYIVNVPGLSYDAQSETINLESEGQIIECAKYVVRGRSIFKRKVLELTERCRFEKRTVLVSQDDGFEIKTDKRLHVYLIAE